MKKYNVELPKKNKLGKIGHIFIEVKIANELYTTIKNTINEKHDLENIFKYDDLKQFKNDLINKDPFLIKIDNHLNNENSFIYYEFYKDKALELTHLRDRRIGGDFNVFGKIFTGLDYVRPEINTLKEDVKNLILINKKIESTNLKEIDSNQKLRIIKDKHYEIEKYSTLKGEPKSILLIEYLLIKENVINDYLFGKGKQFERGAKFKELYNNSYESVIKTKTNHLKNRKDFEELLSQKEILEKAILFVYLNQQNNKENINNRLLNLLLVLYKID